MITVKNNNDNDTTIVFSLAKKIRVVGVLSVMPDFFFFFGRNIFAGPRLALYIL